MSRESERIRQEELDLLLEKFISETITREERLRMVVLLTAVRDNQAHEVHLAVGDRLAASILLRVIKDMA